MSTFDPKRHQRRHFDHLVVQAGKNSTELQYRLGRAHKIRRWKQVFLSWHMDDLPWGRVEATSDNNTISVADLPPGQHKMLVELVDANHHVFAGCAECRQTVTFTVPKTTSGAH